MYHEFAHSVAAPATASKAFTVGTLVTDLEQYDALIASFVAAGFDPADTEFLYIDNTATTQTGAYTGLNRILGAAQGKYVILCHQDVRLIDDRSTLQARLESLATTDPHWAVAGNAGGTRPGHLAIRITDPHGSDRRIGPFPARVASLDENFLVVRKATRIGFSRDLEGFHFYGADICLAADMMGYSAYVIDFHLDHLSPGRKDPSFEAMQRAFRRKWSRALRPRWVQTTCALVRLAGTPVSRLAGRLFERPVSKLVRRLPGAMAWRRSA